MEGGVDMDERVETPPNAERQEPVAEEEQEEGNKFQKAIGAWRNIDLTTLIPQLDTVASDIVAHQRDTLTQRKDLAQKTKDFRKLDDASKLSDIKGLLKSYQNFIDLISNQSKTVQAAFFQVYSPLSEAPDPYPLLEASVDSLVTSEELVPKLTSENERLQKTVAKLTTQLDDSDKKLEEERTARKALEDSRDSKIKDVEASWSAVLNEKQDNWESKEKSLEEKVENQDRLLKELKASYEVSQRLGQGEASEEEGGRGATAAELEIVSSELERTSHRLAEITARNEQLRLELAQSASAPAQQVAVEDDPAFLRLRSENSSLLRKLENARFEKDSERTRLETETRSLEREIKSLRSEKEALREKVQKWGDYENVKQELEVLKSIEFATGDDDDEATEIALSQNSTSSKGKGETLEQLLLARNKKLSNELTVMRVSHQDLQSRLEALQEELSNTNMDLEKSRQLNETLEADLEKVQQEATNAFDPSGMSVAGTYVSRYPQSSFGGGRRGRSSPTSSIISGFDNSSQAPTLASLRAGGGGEPMGGGSGILPMITAQRDRFKKRNSELEAELQKSYQTVSSLRSEIGALQKDNLDLYEKTRYVSSYNAVNRGPASSASSYATNPNPSAINIDSGGTGSTVDTKYRSAYESNLSPFAAFRGRESARAMKRMHLFERMVLRVTKFVLQTRTSRNIFAGYLLALHFMVFYFLFSFEAGAGAAVVAGPTVPGGPVPGPEDPGVWHNEDEGTS
ncbi:CASP C terminal-domain-containing protein [Alternaria rosae]|uniref:CASP C terminal-domain-containing protein n=1 Tax=Alternaria rosae TaxID=1187941 RepID=UPI001E8D19A1|nr:CASP C terminal-domain-containing protein [Alternaria rosae]KAH6857328.1 CASP C terminal-domain-containing protein [Alternaria rosae]